MARHLKNLNVVPARLGYHQIRLRPKTEQSRRPSQPAQNICGTRPSGAGLR